MQGCQPWPPPPKRHTTPASRLLACKQVYNPAIADDACCRHPAMRRLLGSGLVSHTAVSQHALQHRSCLWFAHQLGASPGQTGPVEWWGMLNSSKTGLSKLRRALAPAGVVQAMREPAHRTQLMGPSPCCRTVSRLPSQPCTPCLDLSPATCARCAPALAQPARQSRGTAPKCPFNDAVSEHCVGRQVWQCKEAAYPGHQC